MTSEEIEKVIEDICKNLCKYPQLYLSQYNDMDDAVYYMTERVCQNCPLEKLRDQG